MFSVIYEADPGFRSKVVAMEGDILEPSFGLNGDNLKTVQTEVNVVFHCAATVRFDEKLGYEKKLVVFFHDSFISTAPS